MSIAFLVILSVLVYMLGVFVLSYADWKTLHLARWWWFYIGLALWPLCVMPIAIVVIICVIYLIPMHLGEQLAEDGIREFLWSIFFLIAVLFLPLSPLIKFCVLWLRPKKKRRSQNG